MYPREMLQKLVPEQLDQHEYDLYAELADAVFFASLMIEEGEPVRIAVVYHPLGEPAVLQMSAMTERTARTTGRGLSPRSSSSPKNSKPAGSRSFRAVPNTVLS